MLERMAELIESRPAAEGLWDSVEFALTEIACSPDAEPDQFVTLIRLLESEPALADHHTRDGVVSEQKARFEGVISCRGQQTELGLLERLIFAGAVGTLRVALEMWTEGLAPAETDLRTFLGEAFRLTKSGLAQPVTAAPH